MEERSRASLAMYNNYIVQYKALLLQCEKEYDLMINVRLSFDVQLKVGLFEVECQTFSGFEQFELTRIWLVLMPKSKAS